MNNLVLLRSLQTGYRLDYNKDARTFHAIKEKRAKGCCKRIKGESAKQAQALDQAIQALKVSLNGDQPLTSSQLISVHTRLSKRIHFIRSRTTGFTGWIRGLMRGKKETKSLKKVGRKLNEMRLLISRVEGATSLLVNNKIRENSSDAKRWKAIQQEFPELILPNSTRRSVTNRDFGITDQNQTPKVPFLIRRIKGSISGYNIYFPPINPNHSDRALSTPQHSFLFHLGSLQSEHERHMQIRLVYLFGHINQEIGNSIEARSSPDILSDADIPYSAATFDNQNLVKITFLNPETNQYETETFSLHNMTTPAQLTAWFREARNHKIERANRIREFLDQTFTEQLISQGFNYSTKDGRLSFTPPKNKFSVSTIYVDGLGQNSFDKIKELSSKLVNNITTLEKAVTQNNTIKIQNSIFKVEWNPTHQHFVFKEQVSRKHKAAKTYTTCSYKDDVNKTIQDLQAIVPILNRVNLSTSALKETSPLTGELNVQKLADVAVSTLNTLKNRIDFSGHDLSTANDGRPISQASILSGIGTIADTIKKYRAGENFTYYGIPNDADERKKYFDDLEARLTHIIHALEQPANKAMLSEVMINLGVGGNHCGGRWKDEVYNYYSILCRPTIQETNVSLDQWLQLKIDQQKQEAFDKMVDKGDGSNTGHLRMRYLKSLASQDVSVPGWEAAMYTDPYSNLGGGVFDADILPLFFKKFDFFSLIRDCREQINKRLEKVDGNKKEKAVCQNFGGQVINRLRSAIREFVLPHMPDEKTIYEQKSSRDLKDAYLDEIIEKLGLITINENLLVMDGVTARGMALLLFQTEKMKLKQTDQNILKFIQNLPSPPATT